MQGRRAAVYPGNMNTHILPSPSSGQLMLIVSPSSMLDTLFEMVARLAVQGPLYVLDAGNTFQGYYLARALRRYSSDIATPMQRVMLSRAFTCYQIAAQLEETISDTQPILLLDFLSTFYDQGVRTADRRRLLNTCLRRLQSLSRRVPLAMWIRQRTVIPQEALSFLGTVQAAADVVWYPPKRPALPVMQQAALF